MEPAKPVSAGERKTTGAASPAFPEGGNVVRELGANLVHEPAQLRHPGPVGDAQLGLGLFDDVAIEACIRMDADEGLFACVCQADGRRTTIRVLLSGKSV